VHWRISQSTTAILCDLHLIAMPPVIVKDGKVHAK